MRRVVELASGTLRLDVLRAELPLDALCGFADRRNARRGFLFVSKVLGKHIPVRPAQMAEIHALLAAKIPRDLPGPIAFVALAETAIGLGASVYSELRARREDTVFLHSTRYLVGDGERLGFFEPHSHAPSQLLHVPIHLDPRARFLGARTLVLIDDEISSGNTLINAIAAIRAVNPSIEQVVLACITDWSASSPSVSERVGLPVRFVSALEGRYAFEPRAAIDHGAPPAEAPRMEKKDEILRGNFGRLGVVEPPTVTSLPAIDPRARRVLVLGTGEFLHLPFLVARALEASGLDVEFQSTTRSPIAVGGAIEAKLELVDNYFDGIANYLYNARPGSHDAVIACYETVRQPPEHDLLAQMRATAWTPS